MSEKYNKVIASHYSAYRPQLHDMILNKVIAINEKFGNGLDIGCGTGYSAIALAKYCSHVYGVEPSKSMLKEAISHENITYLQGSGDSLPVADNSTNIVTFAGSLFYAKSTELIKELRRVCLDKSVIINYDFMVLLDDILNHFNIVPSNTISDYDYEVNFNDNADFTKLIVRKEQTSMGRRKKRESYFQERLPFTRHGGFRRGAGRPKKKGAGVPHRTREALSRHEPVHVTVRLEEGLWSLRRKGVFRVVRRCLIAGADRFGFRVNHFSVQSNHLHLIVEVENRQAMTRGMSGLKIRIAKALNKHWRRSGRVFAGRYGEHVLRMPREVRNALRYVLNNAVKHNGILLPGEPDVCSSGRWFDGWSNWDDPWALPPPIPPARTWLQRFGWWKAGGAFPVNVLHAVQ